MCEISIWAVTEHGFSLFLWLSKVTNAWRLGSWSFSRLLLIVLSLFVCISLCSWAFSASFMYCFQKRQCGLCCGESHPHKWEDLWECWWYFLSINKYQCCYLEKNRWGTIWCPWFDWNFNLSHWNDGCQNSLHGKYIYIVNGKKIKVIVKFNQSKKERERGESNNLLSYVWIGSSWNFFF